MGLFNKKPPAFEVSAKLLAQKGFCDDYIDALKEDISKAEKPRDINKGKSYLCNALIICGRLSESFDVFNEVDLNTLDSILAPNLVQNMIFSFFVQNKFSDADELYYKHNRLVLHDHTDSMRRTLAIHEHIQGRYENSITILAKMLESDCRFLDICLIKSMLKLDMYEAASEIGSSLNAYDGLSELGKESMKLKRKILNALDGSRIKHVHKSNSKKKK